MLGTPIWPNMRVPGPRLKNPSAIPGYVSNELLMQPRSYTKTYGDRAFAVHAPRKWNLTPFRVLKDHLRRTCLLNLVRTDNCFYRFVYIA